jgi:hypothetical protein
MIGKIIDIAWTGDDSRLAIVGEGKSIFGRVFILDTGSSGGEVAGTTK